MFIIIIIILISSVKLVFWVGIIAVAYTRSVANEQLTITLLTLGMVLADILDGIIVEKIFTEKGARIRRLYDNITDVIVSHSVAILLFCQLHWNMLWYVPLLVRDIFLSFLAIVSLLKARTVVFPGIAHKAAKGGLAVAAVAMVWGWHGELALILAYAVFYLSLLDYYGAFRFFYTNSNQVKAGVGEIHMPNRFAHLEHVLTSTRWLLAAGKPSKLITAKADSEVKKAHDAVKGLFFFTTPAYWLVWSSWKNLGAMHMGYYENSTIDHNAAVLRLVDKVAELVGVNGSDNVLDAGCGNGCALIRLYQNYRCKGVGVNIVPLHVWIARILAFFRGASLKVKFQTADFAETPFAGESFSVVWFMESLCHAPDKFAALKEAWRVLQSGGRIVICDGASRHDPPLDEKERQFIKVWWDGHAVPSLPTSVEHEDMLKRTGFTQIEIHDFTQQVRPSLERLGNISRRSLEKVTGRINGWRIANKIASVRMHETFERGLWQYKVITAQKP